VLIHELAFYVHITAGCAGLILFWVPMLSRKGSPRHKQIGRWFAIIMYTVAASGLVMASLDLAWPLVMHPASTPLSDAQTQSWMAEVRYTAGFLWSLSILVLVTTRHGWLTILQREDRAPLRSPLHVTLCSLLMAAGLVMLYMGLRGYDLLLLAFGALEVWVAASCLHYAFKARLQHPREWWTEHLGALTASGIAAYTAFFVFGGARLLQAWIPDSFAGLSILLWVGPGVIGGIAIGRMTAHYRRRFAQPSQNQTV
tara:strand:- start:2356 stop:3123 length:768 start_codon:yes stop_codon:yes gene_type:complete